MLRSLLKESADDIVMAIVEDPTLLLYVEDLLEQLEAKQKALAAALDVAIWLSALIGNPDGAADPQAAETWENEMRPKLFAALHESNPAPDCDQSSTCRAETHKPWCFAESNPTSGERVATGQPSRTSATTGANQSPEESSPSTQLGSSTPRSNFEGGSVEASNPADSRETDEQRVERVPRPGSAPAINQEESA